MLSSLFLTNILIQILIIGALVVLFLVLYIINHHVKAPKGIELPEKCSTCESASCMIKLKDAETLKEELKKELEKCELNEQNEKNEENKE